MDSNTLLSSLVSILSLSYNVIPGEVTINYNRFKNQTFINVIGQQVKGQPVLQVLDSFRGRKPNPRSTIEIGFLVPNGCPFPNFLVDGKRVEPDSSGRNTLGMGLTPIVETLGGIQQAYTFVFNFYKPYQVEQIATAKVVKYQICNKIYTLAPQDQDYLRQVTSYYNVDRK